MKQQIDSPFSCHHRKFATRLQTHHVLRISRQKSGICCSLSFTRLSFRMRRRLKFFTAHFALGTFGAFFQNFGAAARAGIRNQGPAGSESRIRPAARPGIKNQGRCAARNRESRITAGGQPNTLLTALACSAHWIGVYDRCLDTFMHSGAVTIMTGIMPCRCVSTILSASLDLNLV